MGGLVQQLRLHSQTPVMKKQPHKYENAISKSCIYNELMLSYDIGDIQNVILWLEYRGYITSFGYGTIAPEMGYELKEKGIAYANTLVMADEDKERLSATTVSVQPSIYGVSINRKEVWWRIKQKLK